jgi:hypothetical protein
MTPRSAVLALAALLCLAPAAASSATTSAKSGTKSATASKAHAAMTVPFIDDDYTRAVAKAKSSKLPIFVEAWAPW